MRSLVRSSPSHSCLFAQPTSSLLGCLGVETRSHSVAHTTLELVAGLLFRPPDYWDVSKLTGVSYYDQVLFFFLLERGLGPARWLGR